MRYSYSLLLCLLLTSCTRATPASPDWWQWPVAIGVFMFSIWIIDTLGRKEEERRSTMSDSELQDEADRAAW